ncbi:MAG TPA: DoxX family protein [Gemmatimonadaceae bacterium]|nr:DoxX family protein [Gemmatimonadaceae bacterium]
MNVFSTKPSERQLGLGLLVLRLALGTVFLTHGGQKLFIGGFSGTASMLGRMGIPAAGIIGPVLAIVEPLAGAALVLGLFTRVAGLVVAIDMLGAIMTFHRLHGFFVPAGIEFPMMLCASGFALAMLGAGSFSVDQALSKRNPN